MGRGLYFRMLDAAKSRKASEDSPTRLGFGDGSASGFLRVPSATRKFSPRLSVTSTTLSRCWSSSNAESRYPNS
jgi:hypothetical protein